MSIVYIVSAPSGSGKSTLVNELFKMVRNLDFSISYTTRPPRGSEQNGKEYFFVSKPEFEAMIAADEFLEYATVFGNYYGTARRFLNEAENRSNFRRPSRTPETHRPRSWPQILAWRRRNIPCRSVRFRAAGAWCRRSRSPGYEPS